MLMLRKVRFLSHINCNEQFLMCCRVIDMQIVYILLLGNSPFFGYVVKRTKNN